MSIFSISKRCFPKIHQQECPTTLSAWPSFRVTSPFSALIIADIQRMFCCFRYNVATEVFTVPSGGAGWYYFSIFIVTSCGENGLFEIHINNEPVCTSIGDLDGSGLDVPQATCSAVANTAEDNEFELNCKFSLGNSGMITTDSRR